MTVLSKKVFSIREEVKVSLQEKFNLNFSDEQIDEVVDSITEYDTF